MSSANDPENIDESGTQKDNDQSATGSNASSSNSEQGMDASSNKSEQRTDASSSNSRQGSDDEKNNSSNKQKMQDTKSTKSSTKPNNSDDEKKKSPRPFIIVLIVLIVGALVTFQIIRNKPEGKPGWLRVSGRIEGYEVNLGAKIAGRVESITKREGEGVEKGEELVKLSDEDIQAQSRGAIARYNESLESVHEAEEALKGSKEQVEQAKLNVSQSKQDAKGRVEQAEAQIASQKAELSQTVANEVQAKADLELATIRKKRYDDLVVKGAVTQDEDDQAHATFDSAVATVAARRAAVIAAERMVSSYQAALEQVKSNLLNPPIRLSQQNINSRTVAQNEAALAKAHHDVANAKSSVDEIKANLQYLKLNSPIHGVVTARTVEPGAVVSAGQTVISLINLDTVFLRAYVPDNEIGKVRLHQKVLVYYDSNPKKGLNGTIIEIDPQASFTPENIYFRDDRVKQVFGIKILIDNPSNYAKPGMPADADIDVQAASGETAT